MTLYDQGLLDISENKEQASALATTSNTLLLAGPGSGKTKVLVHKVAKTLREVLKKPRQVACITYSTECAAEIEDRLDRIDANDPDSLFIGTVHSFFFKWIVIPFGSRIGISPHIRVATKKERDQHFSEAVANVISVDEEPAKWTTHCDNYRKDKWERKSDWKTEDSKAANVVEDYERRLQEKNLIDFDGMVVLSLQLLHRDDSICKFLEARFPFIYIDEYQDLGSPLHALVLRLLKKTDIVFFLVGDPDQSIYGFSGAHPELLKEIRDLPSFVTIIPKINYRCPAKIVNVSIAALGEARDYRASSKIPGSIQAHHVVSGIEGQAKILATKILPEYLSRNPGMQLGDIGVLYRTKDIGDVLASAFRTYNIRCIRTDKGVPYARVPITRFTEELAGYCANPDARVLLKIRKRFHRLHYINGNPIDPRLLTSFTAWCLDARGKGHARLADWLGELKDGPLKHLLEAAESADHREGFSSLEGAAVKELANASIQSFGFHRGSELHATLTTLHSAKGLEFDMVAMVGMDEGSLPNYYERKDQKKLEEARRLFYVGVTRSINELHFLYSGFFKNKWNKIYRNGPSKFMTDLGEVFDVADIIDGK